jgi:large subunit ribosomal protein L11
MEYGLAIQLHQLLLFFPFSPMSVVRRAVKVVRATVPANNASMSGLGAQLGQHGFKVIDFCKQFNERSAAYAKDTPITCVINLFKDRSFDFAMGTPKTAHLIKLAAQGTNTILDKDCYNIALIKNNGSPYLLEAVARSVVGSALSMKIKVAKAYALAPGELVDAPLPGSGAAAAKVKKAGGKSGGAGGAGKAKAAPAKAAATPATPAAATPAAKKK